MKKLIIFFICLCGVTANAAVTQVNLKTWAKGDGVTDDTAAFATAIARVGTSVSTIYIPAGTYRISSAITINKTNEITFVGDSTVGGDANSGTIIKLAPGANCNMLHKSVGTRINVKGIVFDGNKDNQTTTGLYGIWLESNNTIIDRCRLEDVIVQNINGTGIYNNAREARFSRVKVQYCEGDGVVSTASSDVRFEEFFAGYNNGNGLLLKGAAHHYVVSGDIYRNIRGVCLTNASKNFFIQVNMDANEREGILVSSSVGGISYRNEFIACYPAMNNFLYSHELGVTATSEASGTWSNVRLLGDGTTDTFFIGCQFFDQEDYYFGLAGGTKPKYQVEDDRPYYIANDIRYTSTFFQNCLFSSDADRTASGPYHADMIVSGNIENSSLDAARLFRDNTYLRELTSQTVKVSDQLESANGVQGNVYYSGGNWLYRANGYGWWLRQRPDNKLFALQYATTGVADAVAPLVSALTLDATTGYFGIGLAETPARAMLDVNSTIKGNQFETTFGMFGNVASSTFRLDGYGWNVKSRYDSPTFGIQYAGYGTAGSAATLTTALNVWTNGYVGIGLGDTAAEALLDVAGVSKANQFESAYGIFGNAYYGSAAWRRRDAGYAGYVQMHVGTGSLILNVADTDAADAVITWLPALSIDSASGNVTIQEDLSVGGTLTVPTIEMDTLNVGEIGVTNSITASNIVASTTINATNGFAVATQPGIAATVNVLVSGGTTNRMVWVGGILVSNITDYAE